MTRSGGQPGFRRPSVRSLFHKKCNLLKARVIIYAYHHVRLLPPEPFVVKQPQFTRVKEPTLLCNHVDCFRARLLFRGVQSIHDGRIDRREVNENASYPQTIHR